MSKISEKKKKQTVEVNAEIVAETSKQIYESFLRKGFTTQQSFDLLMAIMTRGS